MRVHYLQRHHSYLAIHHHRYAHRYERRNRALAREVRHEWHEQFVEHTEATVHSGGSSGIASVYSGGRTANGEFASSGGLTAAHRSLPFGTMVRVTNNRTGRSVIVRINDRGPFVRGRVIDLTPAGARALGFSGLAPVTLAVVGRG